MSKGLKIEPGKIYTIDGTRIPWTTDGRLLNFLRSPTVDVTKSITYPDFPKGLARYHHYHVTRAVDVEFNTHYALVCEGGTWHTRTPQEWSSTMVIASVPSGADIFWGLVRINRTTAPTHDWAGQPVDVLIKENVWIPFNGSALLEAELNMARAMSIYIESGNLILHQQQTLGPAAGGFGQSSGYSTPVGNSGTGGDGYIWSAPGDEGFAVHAGDTTSYGPYTTTSWLNISVGGKWKNCRWDYDNAPSQTDPTDYSSTYSIEIKGQFGRRS